MYDKTWEIFYNYTYYDIFNIYGNFQLFDAVIEHFYVNDIIHIEREILAFEIWLNISNVSIIISTLFIELIKKKQER